MVSRVVRAAEPNDTEWFIVIVMMSLGLRIGAEFAR